MADFTDENQERAVVAGVMYGQDAADSILAEDCFTNSLCRSAYHHSYGLKQAGGVVNPGNVQASMRQSGIEVDGNEWALLLKGALRDASLMVKGATKLRNLAAERHARRIMGEFMDGAGEVQDRIRDVQTKLASVEAGRITPVVDLATVVHDFEVEYEKQMIGGKDAEPILTGYKALDDATGGFMPGIMHLYAGRPGQGKSSLLTGFLRHLGAAGVPTGVFWLEDPATMLALRMIAAEGHIPSPLLRHGSSMRDSLAKDRFLQAEQVAAGTISKWPIYVESTRGLRPIEICQKMRRMHREKGIKVFFVDHIGKVKIGGNERTDMEIGDFAADFLDQAATLGACPVAFHQLSRKADDPNNAGQDSLSWLFNSDLLGQHARVVGFLSHTKDRFKIKLVKATYGDGDSKVVELGWNGQEMSVYNLGVQTKEPSNEQEEIPYREEP